MHRIYGFVFALMLCATVVGAPPQSARFNNTPPQAAETPPDSSSHGQLQPVW
jgi:hypothetical protein